MLLPDEERTFTPNGSPIKRRTSMAAPARSSVGAGDEAFARWLQAQEEPPPAEPRAASWLAEELPFGRGFAVQEVARVLERETSAISSKRPVTL